MTSGWLSVVVVGSSIALPAGAVNVPPKMLKYALLSCLSDEVMGYCAGQITQVCGLGPSMKRWKTYPALLLDKTANTRGGM